MAVAGALRDLLRAWSHERHLVSVNRVLLTLSLGRAPGEEDAIELEAGRPCCFARRGEEEGGDTFITTSV